MHSWHLHGHSFYVVGFGFGTFNEETDPESSNLDDPVRQDTVSVLPLRWTAFRVNTSQTYHSNILNFLIQAYFS